MIRKKLLDHFASIMKAQKLLQQEAEAPETVALESQQRIRRRFPIGAEPASAGGTHFRVWAPRSRAVSVLLSEQKDLSQAEEFRLEAEPDGYFSELVPAAN